MTSKSKKNSHPRLHPSLENLDCLSIAVNFPNDQIAIKFCQDLKLIPSQDSTPPSCCNLPMKVECNSTSKLGWRWCCSSKGSKRKGSKACRKTIAPTVGTFFDGALVQLEFCETIAIIALFILKQTVSQTHDCIQSWRRLRYKDSSLTLSRKTICCYFKMFRNIIQVIVSNVNIKLGGVGKTVQIDETFLTRRKYHRGRVTKQMTTTILGIYCKEDKHGIFVRVPSKSKESIWPWVSRYADKETSVVCTDMGKQYSGIKELFSGDTDHLQTNHSKGQYVDKFDSRNTTNHIENRNRYVKQEMKSSVTPEAIDEYLSLFYYRQYVLNKLYPKDKPSHIMHFLEDIRKVYPAFVDGKREEPLKACLVEKPTVSSEGLEEIILPTKKRRI